MAGISCACSMGVWAAIYHTPRNCPPSTADVLTGEERRTLRGEERDEPADLLRAGESLHRDARQPQLAPAPRLSCPAAFACASTSERSRSVSVEPGSTLLTVMPSAATSSARSLA